MTKEEIISFKILLLGDSTVGKTAFILRFCEDKFDEDSLTTIGLDQKNKYVKRGDKKIELHIWDTAGQERFRAIAKNLYKGADGILLMYDMSNLNSFNHIKEWINSIKESVDISKIALIIVGNKCDLTTQEITVDEEKKKNFEETRKLKIIEASAKKNINVNDSFIVLIDKMLALGLGKKKTNGIDDDGNQKLQNNNNDKKRSNCCGGGEKRNKNN
jgi:small GTP-binding protein